MLVSVPLIAVGYLVEVRMWNFVEFSEFVVGGVLLVMALRVCIPLWIIFDFLGESTN